MLYDSQNWWLEWAHVCGSVFKGPLWSYTQSGVTFMQSLWLGWHEGRLNNSYDQHYVMMSLISSLIIARVCWKAMYTTVLRLVWWICLRHCLRGSSLEREVSWFERCPGKVSWLEKCPSKLSWLERCPSKLSWLERCPRKVSWLERCPRKVSWLERCLSKVSAIKCIWKNPYYLPYKCEMNIMYCVLLYEWCSKGVSVVCVCVCVCVRANCVSNIRSDKCCISHCLLDIISPVQLDTLQTGFQGSTRKHNTTRIT